MSVLVYAESTEGIYKKAVFEQVSYAHHVAQTLGTDVLALTFGEAGYDQLGTYGANKVLAVKNDLYKDFDAGLYAAAIAKATQNSGAEVIVMAHNPSGRAVAPRLSVLLKAGLVSGAVDYPVIEGNFKVKRGVYSGKAFAYCVVDSPVKIISVTPNATSINENPVEALIEEWDPGLDSNLKKVKVKAVDRIKGKVPLPEAELVVSAGRGLKGPENWGMIEELAEVLGASTACSRPVADSGWRPHYEHVGQTGGTIRPNLYLAIGISGAIQHLAGVNQSKVIAVINTDPEAPFFKAADYGIIGDAFEVVPKLIEAAKKIKQDH